MRIISGVFAFLFFLAGLGALGFAVITPFGASLTSASAIQVTQVYTQGVFYAALGIGLLLAAVVVTLAMVGDRVHELLEAQRAHPIQAPVPTSRIDEERAKVMRGNQ